MRKLDLTGQRFGKLTVLRRAENIRDRTAWMCRCDCGRETIVRTGHLRNGRIKACGCRHYVGDSLNLVFLRDTCGGKRTQGRRLDLTGQRFGKLTVLRPAENIGDDAAWVCRCDCGQETVVRTGRLRNGAVKTCGSQYCRFYGRPIRKDNTSGVTGVEWGSREGQWRATICIKGQRRYLGSYAEFEDAVAARRRAEAELYAPSPRGFAGPQTQNAMEG